MELGAAALTGAKAPAVLPTVALQQQITSRYYENSFGLVDTLKGFPRPQGLQSTLVNQCSRQRGGTTDK